MQNLSRKPIVVRFHGKEIRNTIEDRYKRICKIV
jgi:hypothetical protein